MQRSGVLSLVTLECHPVWTHFIAIWRLRSLMLYLWPWTKHQALATSWIWGCRVNLGEELCCSSEYIINTHLPILETEYSNFPHTSGFCILTTAAASSGRSCSCRGVLLHTLSEPKMVLFLSLFKQDYPLCSPLPPLLTATLCEDRTRGHFNNEDGLTATECT